MYNHASIRALWPSVICIKEIDNMKVPIQFGYVSVGDVFFLVFIPDLFIW